MSRFSFKTSLFSQSLRHEKILILEILLICLRLKFVHSLTLGKIEHFEAESTVFKKLMSFYDL